MFHRSIHRGIVALAVVTSMSLAGAQPAAARDLGFTARLGHLMSVLDPGLWAKLTGWLSPDKPTKATSSSNPSTGEKGWGLDPNGNSLTTAPTSDPLGLP
jgi:hypothetical protein